MGIKTGITWAHSTFNPWWGCVKVSPGCANCYAEADSRRYGYAVWGKESPRRFFSDKHWDEPRKWNREAEMVPAPWRVFCASMADILEEKTGLDALRARLWGLIERTPHLTWLLLTKRPENYARMVPERWMTGQWPTNAWAGFTAEDQPRLDERFPHMRTLPAPIIWCSAETLLGPICFQGWNGSKQYNYLTDRTGKGIDWGVLGGEGIGRRPCEVEWIRAGVRQFKAAGLPAFVKQLGSNVVLDVPMAITPEQSKLKTKQWKGADFTEWPEDLRVQEFPKVPA